MRAFIPFAALCLWLGAAHAEEAPQAEQIEGGGQAPLDPTLTPTAEQAVREDVSSRRLYQVNAAIQFRMLATVDEDPDNDQLMVYSAGGSVEPFENAAVFIRGGFTQAFVEESGGTVETPARTFTAEGEDEAVQIQDTQIGLTYKTPIELTEDRTLGLSHTLKLYLPTSRQSRAQDLYLAPQAIVALNSKLVGDLSASFATSFRYRFHAFAERAGERAGMNTQLDTGVSFGLNYAILKGTAGGDLGVGANVLSNWSKKYASRDEHESAFADSGNWLQTWGWSVGAEYTPIKYVSVSAAVEHAMPVLRGGIVNVDFLHRDATELVFALTGRY